MHTVSSGTHAQNRKHNTQQPATPRRQPPNTEHANVHRHRDEAPTRRKGAPEYEGVTSQGRTRGAKRAAKRQRRSQAQNDLLQATTGATTHHEAGGRGRRTANTPMLRPMHHKRARRCRYNIKITISNGMRIIALLPSSACVIGSEEPLAVC